MGIMLTVIECTPISDDKIREDVQTRLLEAINLFEDFPQLENQFMIIRDDKIITLKIEKKSKN